MATDQPPKKPDEPGGTSKTNGNGFPLPKFVGILHSEVKREYFPTETQYLTEKDATHEAEVIATYLVKMGIKTKLYAGRPETLSSILRDKPDMIFNLVGSISGQEYLSATIPGILEAMDIPYTGAGMLGEALAYNKYLVKELLVSHGIPVPRTQLLTSATTPLNPELRFPLITKLNEIHGAVEVTQDAISPDEKHLRDRIKFLIKTYQQPIIAEEFIAGREYTAIVLEGGNTKVYLAEKVFPDATDPMQFVTFDAQWVEGGETYTYKKISDPTLNELVRRAFDILKMGGYGKFDIRVDQSGRYYFIDSNSNPAFGPKELDVALANILSLYEIDFPEILKRLMVNTMRDWFKTQEERSASGS
ncbi:MAG: D-alanine-D-alanine ligase [Microgenomates group bacterium GW2011_GWC1_46_16]|uniref:ATP-grasp domain-containing protein n=2 Tax=Candidatus Collieribacteriota TaxID=1752725 RepID=A0A1F5G0E5_9BACT|nr:MAG: D-alanine-D-alanine ligase [Microgenomates group bacterium GW2011_GWF1_46_12]KKU26930.1 MAG: D-alanine-D-alanine ligase [Microgenomates group bacterium GW2011_GWC1_46_16]KKU28347.1 MAG: D-alanine-D-alanine ligase [Microgenomates group bacterium GW2011_GWF2_46_18]KKU43699.1 MAG: D-alanine-D-alanine ligase [Microgenomates group bacterium GW2011_GWA1_46_7]KKU45192.1 MAG: D-alanine-D-alanine ligase [Microgenomates group bacterium GW2011_GWB1_46_7]KKU62164.1 MAG: D-alanine-D-alanine ligase 